MRTIVHISDLHFGVIHRARVQPLIDIIWKIKPDLTVISGDLTQWALRREFRAARQFLEHLPEPRLVIPGNHDVPMANPFLRFFAPLHRYKKFITDELLPTYVDEEIAVVGINTARSLVIDAGRISPAQLRHIKDELCQLPKGVLKIIALHHPIDLPMQFKDRKLVRRARVAMETMAECGADLFLAGHMHLGYSGLTSTRYTIAGYAALVVQAGTAISRRARHDEPNSFNVIRVDRPDVHVDRYHWHETHFDLVTCERFHHTSNGWQQSEIESHRV